MVSGGSVVEISRRSVILSSLTLYTCRFRFLRATQISTANGLLFRGFSFRQNVVTPLILAPDTIG